jgi:hypothetical protein
VQAPGTAQGCRTPENGGRLAADLRARPVWIMPGRLPGRLWPCGTAARLADKRLAGLAFTGALEDSGDFGQEIGAPGGELTEFGHGGGFLGPGGSRRRA